MEGPAVLLRCPLAAHRRFGAGSITKLPNRIAQYSQRVLLVIGPAFTGESPNEPALLLGYPGKAGIQWEEVKVNDRPSPQLVDQVVRQFHESNMQVVIGIRGRRVMDAARRVGLLPSGASVMDYLERCRAGKALSWPRHPFIAGAHHGGHWQRKRPKCRAQRAWRQRF
ncbi:MAG: iron-containing alcohol dehydrogenase [Candidatus Competibacteraceae bacterium]|nr:iron-containing alcohol dehydrogenase [Candidatus Competibacteraceae bacterium]